MLQSITQCGKNRICTLISGSQTARNLFLVHYRCKSLPISGLFANQPKPPWGSLLFRLASKLKNELFRLKKTYFPFRNLPHSELSKLHFLKDDGISIVHLEPWKPGQVWDKLETDILSPPAFQLCLVSILVWKSIKTQTLSHIVAFWTLTPPPLFWNKLKIWGGGGIIRLLLKAR